MQISIIKNSNIFNAVFIMEEGVFENPIIINDIPKDGYILIVFKDYPEQHRLYKIKYTNYCIQFGFHSLTEKERVEAELLVIPFINTSNHLH